MMTRLNPKSVMIGIVFKLIKNKLFEVRLKE